MSDYLQYWGLHEKPFEHTAVPKFFYFSPDHGEALSRLKHLATEKKPLGLLTGDFGTGKTMVCYMFKDSLAPDRFAVVHIPNPLLPAVELFGEILNALSDAPRAPNSKSETLRSLREAFNRNLDIGKHTIIIIDEAHLIEGEGVFDELRMLLNYQYKGSFPLSLIFSGQTGLREKIRRLPALNQRISLQYHLRPLPESEIGKYIQHRLKMAGCPKPGDIFEANSDALIYQHSRGMPRIINNVCDLALLSGFRLQAARITAEILKDAFSEVPGYEEVASR